jgi:hypothetical protein
VALSKTDLALILAQIQIQQIQVWQIQVWHKSFLPAQITK